MNPLDNYNYEDFEIIPEGDNEVWLWGFGVYEDSSVLAGQYKQGRCECFPSIEEAVKAFPNVQVRTDGTFVMQVQASMSDCPPDWFDPSHCGRFGKMSVNDFVQVSNYKFTIEVKSLYSPKKNKYRTVIMLPEFTKGGFAGNGQTRLSAFKSAFRKVLIYLDGIYCPNCAEKVKGLKRKC